MSRIRASDESDRSFALTRVRLLTSCLPIQHSMLLLVLIHLALRGVYTHGGRRLQAVSARQRRLNARTHTLVFKGLHTHTHTSTRRPCTRSALTCTHTYTCRHYIRRTGLTFRQATLAQKQAQGRLARCRLQVRVPRRRPSTSTTVFTDALYADSTVSKFCTNSKAKQ